MDSFHAKAPRRRGKREAIAFVIYVPSLREPMTVPLAQVGRRAAKPPVWRFSSTAVMLSANRSLEGGRLKLAARRRALMDFESHLTIISHNLEKEGYDSFFPSICVPGDDLSFDVLAVDLGSHGEEIVAKEWASVVGSEHYFLAYRAGNRMVHVCEVIDHKVVRKQVIEVQPSGAMT